MCLLKQVLDQLLFLTPMQMTTHSIHEFAPNGRPAPAEAIGLNVLLEQLIGAQFRAVPDGCGPLRVPLNKALAGCGSVHWVPVDDQNDLAFDTA